MASRMDPPISRSCWSMTRTFGVRMSLPLLLILAALGVILGLGGCDGYVVVADPYTGRMMEVQGDVPHCQVHNDRNLIRNKLSRVAPQFVRNTSPAEFDALIRACNDNFNGVGGGGHRQTGFIYPGTKWCGPGDKAEAYDDLGYHAAEDACCREHDHCPAILQAGQCLQGLCNNALFTRSHCDCDAQFRRCLHSIGSNTATLIGHIFFNVVQVECFKEKRPCFPEDVDQYTGRCRMRFHTISRYEERSSGGGAPGGIVSNLLSSIFSRR